MMKTIFISYRRADTGLYALALKTELELRLSGTKVFLDHQSIPPSTIWEAVIEKNLLAADTMIALIGDDWIGKGDGTEQARIMGDEDWVRREVVHALKQMPGALYPVLCGGAPMPPKADLPGDLHRVEKVEHETIAVESWESDVDRILKSLVSEQGYTLRADAFNYPRPDSFKMNTPEAERDWLASALASPEMAGWELEGSDDPKAPHQMWLKKKFTFKSFRKAMAFMNAVAPYCETVDHHPRWENVYNELLVSLSTFDAGHKITQLDLQLAVKMNRIAKQQ